MPLPPPRKSQPEPPANLAEASRQVTQGHANADGRIQAIHDNAQSALGDDKRTAKVLEAIEGMCELLGDANDLRKRAGEQAVRSVTPSLLRSAGRLAATQIPSGGPRDDASRSAQVKMWKEQLANTSADPDVAAEAVQLAAKAADACRAVEKEANAALARWNDPLTNAPTGTLSEFMADSRNRENLDASIKRDGASAFGKVYGQALQDDDARAQKLEELARPILVDLLEENEDKLGKRLQTLRGTTFNANDIAKEKGAARRILSAMDQAREARTPPAIVAAQELALSLRGLFRETFGFDPATRTREEAVADMFAPYAVDSSWPTRLAPEFPPTYDWKNGEGR